MARRPTDELRDAAAEFELRAVIQRLEDEWDGDVPGRTVEEDDRGRGGRGRDRRPRRGPDRARDRRRRGGRPATARQVIGGELPDLAALVSALAGTRSIGHDIK